MPMSVGMNRYSYNYLPPVAKGHGQEIIKCLWNVKPAHGKSWSANVLPVNNFGLILKINTVAIANYLKIIKKL